MSVRAAICACACTLLAAGCGREKPRERTRPWSWAPRDVVVLTNETGAATVHWAGAEPAPVEGGCGVRLRLAPLPVDGLSLTTNGAKLALLFCYIRQGASGSVARILETAEFRMADPERGLSMRVFTRGENRELDFCVAGGNMVSTPEYPSPEGALGMVFDSEQLEIERLRQSRTLAVAFFPERFAPDILLEGDGRLAFLLQEGLEPKGRVISDCIEVPALFGPLARNDASHAPHN